MEAVNLFFKAQLTLTGNLNPYSNSNPKNVYLIVNTVNKIAIENDNCVKKKAVLFLELFFNPVLKVESGFD